MLKEFLENKPLYYDKIDYDRMPRIYAKIKDSINLPKIIHIVGTNGKGTTGRFLASALYNLGYNVGHYTSPHILEFNERVWLNSMNVLDCTLDEAHKKLLALLSKDDIDSLSYFEYTTLIAIWIMQHFDYVILEAGLGGEHDATSVFENILTVVTPIDKDHEDFLGNSIKQIATTKLKAIQKSAIFAKQSYDEVYEVAKELNKTFYKVDELLESKDIEKIEFISKKLNLADYLKDNLSLAVSVLKFLEIEYSIYDFDNSKLFGRLTQFRDNIILDVGHNPLAAKSIVNSLSSEKYILVYNSYKDKNYKEILRILKPIILRVEILKIEDNRMEDSDILKESIMQLGIDCGEFKNISSGCKYLVFGSFKVVEKFLKVCDE